MPSLKPKPPKGWTAHQLTRLPAKGYYVSYFSAAPFYTAYFVGSGKCEYARCQPTNITSPGGKGSTFRTGDWHTLLWNCAPTKKKIAASKLLTLTGKLGPHDEQFHYFKDYTDLLTAWNSFAPLYSAVAKAPSDI